DALVGIQDMGAAGLTCSTTEMGSRGGAGIEIDVALVPQRETGMTPYEIMLSESQERMLLVAKRGREAEVERIFEKWDLHAVKIGEVTDNGFLRVRERGALVAEIPNRALTDDAPLYKRPVSEPEYLRELQQLDLNTVTCPADHNAALLALLQSPTVASKRWVYRQYDHMVRTNTINMPGLGAGVVRIKGTDRALALSVDGNGRYGYLDPYRGAMLAVAEASGCSSMRIASWAAGSVNRAMRSCCSARTVASLAEANTSRSFTISCAACRRRSIWRPNEHCRRCLSRWRTKGSRGRRTTAPM